MNGQQSTRGNTKQSTHLKKKERFAMTTVPTPIQSIEAIQRLLSLWDSATTSISVQVLDGGILRGTAIRVQVDHAVALTESILLLNEHGMNIQAMPLVRMTMECVVTAEWLAITPYSADAAARKGAKAHERLMRALAEMAGDNTDADAEDLRKMVDDSAAFASGEAQHFEQRCRALQGGEWIYGYYRLLSKFSHAGTGLLDVYLEQSEPSDATPNGIAFADTTKFPFTNIALGLQAVLLHIALTAWDEVSEGHPHSEMLTGIANELGMSTILQRSKPVA